MVIKAFVAHHAETIAENVISKLKSVQNAFKAIKLLMEIAFSVLLKLVLALL